MDRIKIERGDITAFQGDAIVNATNKDLIVGGGVDGAIHRAAGPKLREETQKKGSCPVGEVFITGGYNLKAKHVIHTVGPIWGDGKQDEEKLLESCYINSLIEAKEKKIKTIAFPAISTGTYGFPLDQATEIAIRTTMQFLKTNELPKQVTFICFDEDSLNEYEVIYDYESDNPFLDDESKELDDLNIWDFQDQIFEQVTEKPMSIWAASYTGNIDQIKKHLDAGVNVDELADGQSPLHYAAGGGMFESISLLIENNADVNAKDKHGNTPLHLVSVKGEKKIIKKGKQDLSKTIELLTTGGADLNVQNELGDTPLHLAARTGHVNTIQHLISKGADVYVKNNNEQAAADLSENHETADFIRKEGAKAPLSQSQFDVFKAVRKGDINGVKQYISSGGEVDKIESSTGSTLLHHACMHDAKEVGELLINHSADVNAKNNNTETPLHFSARKSSRMTELLLENKSDVNAKNEQGRTPMDYTSDNEIILLLRKYGGKKGKE